MKRIIQFLVKATAVFFGILGIALVFISIFKKEWMFELLEWIQIGVQTLGWWNYVIIGVSSLIESFPIIGTLVPGTNVMLIVGGFWGATHFVNSWILASIGAAIGNFFGYIIGYKWGEKFIHKYGHWFGIGETEVKYLKKPINKNGFWFIVFGKFHNFLRAFVPFVAGTLKMHPKSFWTYNIIGSIFWAATMLALGIVFAENYETVIKNAGKIMTLILFGFLGYLWIFKKESLVEYWQEKQEEMDRKFWGK